MIRGNGILSLWISLLRVATYASGAWEIGMATPFRYFCHHHHLITSSIHQEFAYFQRISGNFVVTLQFTILFVRISSAKWFVVCNCDAMKQLTIDKMQNIYVDFEHA